MRKDLVMKPDKSFTSPSSPKSPRKPAPLATENPAPEMIPAAVCITEARKRLEQIRRHLTGVDQVLAAIEDQDEDDGWPKCVAFAVQAIRGEVKNLQEYLGRMVCSQTGEALGIEKGGAR